MLYSSRSLCLLLMPGFSLLAGAAFDPARDVRISCSRGAVTLTAPAGTHLKRRFLAVTLASGPGALRMGALPPAPDRDEGDEPIYRGPVTIPLAGQGLADEVELEIRYQPATEGPAGACYLPAYRKLKVPRGDLAALPAGPHTQTLPALADLQGRPFPLDGLRGSVAVVAFWDATCAPSRRALPALDRLSASFRDRPLRVLGVALDDDPQAAARFLHDTPPGFPIAWDRHKALSRRLGIVTLPTTLILDADGAEVARFEGGGRIPPEEAAVAALRAGLNAGTV